MQSVGSIAKSFASAFGKERAEECAWTCDVCGPVPAHRIASNGRYIAGICQCQKLARSEFAAQKQQRELTAQRTWTYDWFGGFRVDSDEVAASASRTFDGFESRRQPLALESTLNFADMLSGSLVLYGSYGTGKTHLLTALCQELNQRCVFCRFTTAPTLFAAIGWHISHNKDYSDLIRRAVSAPVLVIDDIDKARYSEFREEIYFNILDSRVTASRPTAISTNRLDELEKYMGGACVSRLSLGQIAEEMIGADYRKEM